MDVGHALLAVTLSVVDMITKNNANFKYCCTIQDVMTNGELIETRNHKAYSNINTDKLTFFQFPLVTIRKTAWKKAIREWEWFMTGDPKCPDDLANSWWKGQLNKDGLYKNGYGEQLRSYGNHFDQIDHLVEGIRDHSHSRRNLITTWDSADMSQITFVNNNPNTPTCCHTTIAQFHVRRGKLHMFSYQRSADMLLGLPHNWVQSWSFLLWLCHQAGLLVGSMTWQVGDAHVYYEKSHLDAANQCIDAMYVLDPVGSEDQQQLVYRPTSKEFLASDFHVDGFIPEPIVTVKPKLL